MLAVWSGPRQLAGHPGAAPGPGSQQDTAPLIQHKGTGPVAAAAAAAQGPGPMVEEPGRGTGGHRRERERERGGERDGGWWWWGWVDGRVGFLGDAVSLGRCCVVVLVVDEGGLGWI